MFAPIGMITDVLVIECFRLAMPSIGRITLVRVSELRRGPYADAACLMQSSSSWGRTRIGGEREAARSDIRTLSLS
jgi:hypothetical protein